MEFRVERSRPNSSQTTKYGFKIHLDTWVKQNGILPALETFQVQNCVLGQVDTFLMDCYNWVKCSWLWSTYPHTKTIYPWNPIRPKLGCYAVYKNGKVWSSLIRHSWLPRSQVGSTACCILKQTNQLIWGRNKKMYSIVELLLDKNQL